MRDDLAKMYGTTPMESGKNGYDLTSEIDDLANQMQASVGDDWKGPTSAQMTRLGTMAGKLSQIMTAVDKRKHG